MTLAVVTDSAACLPPALADRCGIEVVPLHAIEDGETPSTARPSVAELAAAYASALERADEVLAIHISSVLSGTVDNARLAYQLMDDLNPHSADDLLRAYGVMMRGLIGDAGPT